MSSRPLTVKAMDALLQAGMKIDNVAAWCREHGVNPRTFYRHRARIRAKGQWRERSRRPHRTPQATSADLDGWICKLRAELGADNGADFIRDELVRIQAATAPAWAVPSRSTINRVLARHELLAGNPAKRPRSSWRRFAYARPRDCYQIDATEVSLAGGRAVVVFDVLDDCTRMLVACHAAPAETAEAAITAISTAFRDHGAPAIVLADNGSAFTHRHRNPDAGPSRFARAVHQAGTHLIHASPYHPQTCGKVERHHQTLKRWLAHQPHPPSTLRQLQHQLDAYRDYYNHHRGHAALRRATPHHAWTTAAHHGGPHALPVQTDATVHHRLVSATGTIAIGHGQRVSVGRHRHGQTLPIIRDHNHITVYTPDGQPLGHATLTTDRAYTTLTPSPPTH
jgi:transposase InsO family protein